MQKICMTADSAAPRVTQNGLFAPAGPDAEKLELTLARLTKLVGEGNVGAAHLDNSHRPESFHLERFSVANEQNTGRGTGHPCPRQPRATTALRIMRPPESIRVDLRDNQPARIYHRGTRGKVLSASGPWRTSGDWWQENPWHQDEWDLEVELAPSSQRIGARDTRARSVPHRALYRIFFDALSQSWFLRGVYDR